MKYFLILCALFSFSGTSYSEVTAKKIWSITSGLSEPESSYYDSESKTIFVSSIKGKGTVKDKEGWISRISTTGKVIDKKWISGLNAPKGLRVFKGVLWVTDIDRVLAYQISNKKKIHEIKIPHSVFLNDIAIAKNGVVYVSDTMTNTIHEIKNGIAKIFLKGDLLESPNGLLVSEPYLRVASWGAGIKADFSTTSLGSLYNIDLKTKKKSLIFKKFGHLDGLESLGKGLEGFLISDWKAGIIYKTSKKKHVLIKGLKGSADIGYVPEMQLLLVPEMLENKLTAYKLNK